jgi:REP element-mobilizing transposase RayT
MHSFHSILVHLVFSSKEREPFLNREIRARLWPYLGGIARENDMRTLAVGGMPDHVHMLLSLPATLAVAKAIQILKGNSSKWLHETFRETRNSSWQEGYGAFSIGISGIEDTVRYIENQEEHHRVRGFREELESFLVRHGLEFEHSMLD